MGHRAHCQGQNFQDPRLLRERERERAREREREREITYGACETFSHNFDLYVVQTAERVYVIVMLREINLCLHTLSQLILN